MPDIEKVAALCVRDKKLLVVKSRKHPVFITLGGKLEPGETQVQCLHREVAEEIGCKVIAFSYLQTFEGMNFNNIKTVRMHCYVVDLEGDIKPQAEIEEIAWVDKDYMLNNTPVAGMLSQHVLPFLIKQTLL